MHHRTRQPHMTPLPPCPSLPFPLPMPLPLSINAGHGSPGCPARLHRPGTQDVQAAGVHGAQGAHRHHLSMPYMSCHESHRFEWEWLTRQEQLVVAINSKRTRMLVTPRALPSPAQHSVLCHSHHPHPITPSLQCGAVEHPNINPTPPLLSPSLHCGAVEDREPGRDPPLVGVCGLGAQ